VDLGPLPEKARQSPAPSGNAGPDQPTQIGTARAVGATSTPAQLTATLNWTPSARGGRVAALRFRSPDARGVRLGMRVGRLPMGSVLRFYADGQDQAFVTSAQEVLSTIQRNLDAGDTSDAAHTYWSPDLRGDAVTLEIELAPASSPSELEISVPALSHIYLDAMRLGQEGPRAGDAGACLVDVGCKAGNAYDTESKSVALTSFVKDGSAYACTGTLLNDLASSGIPYFLSARHCIATQTVASTLMTAWFYRTVSCGSTVLNPGWQLRTGGAALLYASESTDASFMRLNAAPPVGAVYAGSSPFMPSMGSNLFSLHQPGGDVQKYSEGLLAGYASCSAFGPDGTTYCTPATESSGDLFSVQWLKGITQPGSSGGGAFATMNGKSYLVGQLRSGSSSCGVRLGADTYGRFDRAYYGGIHQWLGQGSATVRTPIYRFYNLKTGAHFYTASIAERDKVIADFHEFNYEGIGFYAYAAKAQGANTVYRFYNSRTGAHFYTIDEGERAYVLANFPWYWDNGASWYADTTPAANTTPIYRFYNTKTDTHFYTVSAAERDMVIQNLPQFIYEGPRCYAWSSQ
jgi:hypothetical protein